MSGARLPTRQHGCAIVATSPAACRPLRRGAGAHTARSDAGHAAARRTGAGCPVGNWGAGGTAGAGEAVDAGGPAHPAVQLQLALPAVRSNTHRNSAPQRLHGLPASAGIDKESKQTSCAQPGHITMQPGRYAAMPASCRIETGAHCISRSGICTKLTPAEPPTAATRWQHKRVTPGGGRGSGASLDVNVRRA